MIGVFRNSRAWIQDWRDKNSVKVPQHQQGLKGLVRICAGFKQQQKEQWKPREFRVTGWAAGEECSSLIAKGTQAVAEQPPGSQWMSHSTETEKFSQHLLEKMDFNSSMEYQMKQQKRSQESKCQMQSWRKQLCKHLVPPALSLSSPRPLGAENKPSSVKESPATELSLENAGVGCDLFFSPGCSRPSSAGPQQSDTAHSSLGVTAGTGTSTL